MGDTINETSTGAAASGLEQRRTRGNTEKRASSKYPRTLRQERCEWLLLSSSDILARWAGATRVFERLLDLDGFLAEIGGGFWVKIVARRVPPDAHRPHGVSYTLTLHGPAGRRVFGIDNAHVVRASRGPAGRSSAPRDHLHRGEAVRPYAYSDADTLLGDFWHKV